MENLNIENLNFDARKTLFLTLLRSTNREGIDNVINWLTDKTDFFTAPSSRMYHGNFEGGLCEHSLKVYELTKRIYEQIIEMNPEIADKVSIESVTISALLHDICKCGFYKQTMKWRKNEDNQWEQYPGYEIEDKFPLGHGEKSVYILEHLGLKMQIEEVLAIRWHMGAWEGGFLNTDRISFENAQDNFPLVGILSTADNLSSFLLEKKAEK